MTIEVKQTISATYSEDDIKRLIVADLSKKSVQVTAADIKVSISGGYADDTWKQYSGGFSPSEPEIVPVKFVGFIVFKESKVEGPKTR